MLKRILFKVHSLLFSKAIAFTLAETLIVMGIIGVVAALTLPNLNSSTGDKEKVAKVKKIYQNLNDAFARAQVVYGPYSEWFRNDNANTIRCAQRITEFMKISKNCEMSTNKGCFKNNIIDDASTLPQQCIDSDSSIYKLILADGSSIAFDNIDSSNLQIYVDIDGPNTGSNSTGKDIFAFQYDEHNRSIEPMWFHSVSVITDCPREKGIICTSWVIQNGNMDYLKADSNGKCNNSDVTLNETVTSCK